jgi:hypothetical protein
MAGDGKGGLDHHGRWTYVLPRFWLATLGLDMVKIVEWPALHPKTH